jgi:hypothetical protein
MSPRSREVPYGRAAPDNPGPSARIGEGAALRLCHGPYPFAEPPNLLAAATVAARLELLREHLLSLCRPWDKLADAFLAAYFARIAAAIAAADAELRHLAATGGGLFAPEDWSFCALRPLPQAHLFGARTDFAFWTGGGFIAIELEGSGSPRKQRRDELARLEAAGVAPVRVPGAALQQQGDGLLADILPPPFHRFWAGLTLPASPFGAEALDEILVAR